MIDYFTSEEITSMEYAIISAGIPNQGLATNVVKCISLYPTYETTKAYAELQDDDILKRMYLDELKHSEFLMYKSFVAPVLDHHNIVIVCRKKENIYIDILTNYLEKKFSLQCIDLNQLFISGRVGPLYIDRKEIHNNSVKLVRTAVEKEREVYEATKEGRARLLSNMNEKDKIRLLKKYSGIQLRKDERHKLDEILTEEWVEDE